jgi:hypothetical protein
MKTLAKFTVLALVVLLAIPPLQYKTVSPCRMLEKELVKRTQQEAESAVEEGQEAVSKYGEQAQRLAEQVGAIVENVAEDIAVGVAEMRVEQLSTGQCLRELSRMKLGREPTPGW